MGLANIYCSNRATGWPLSLYHFLVLSQHGELVIFAFLVLHRIQAIVNWSQFSNWSWSPHDVLRDHPHQRSSTYVDDLWCAVMSNGSRKQWLTINHTKQPISAYLHTDSSSMFGFHGYLTKTAYPVLGSAHSSTCKLTVFSFLHTIHDNLLC